MKLISYLSKKLNRRLIAIFLLIFFMKINTQLNAQQANLTQKVQETMLNSTKFMVEKASYNGGYVWYYKPDFSRRWGEMEAYNTMIWLQHPGTISMGHLFLDAYKATGNDYYYLAAQKAAAAVIWGQSNEGGWNYMIDFAGDRSLKHWYNTIGKNAWRLEEFQHYYGNSTFDDDITSDAARFLLRIYLEKLDPTYKPSLDKAINFILKSQYSSGGWPQRYPLKYDFGKQGNPDYTSFYTFNDDVIWENVHFLIQCYQTLGEERFLDPILRGMNFYLNAQADCGAWGQQLNMQFQTAGARTYEPAAFLPSTTCENAILLLKFYEFTGDKKFLVQVPKAIKWLEETKLPNHQIEGTRTHPTFVEVETNKAIYVHRKGSNVKFGYYYIDKNDQNLLGHYSGKRTIELDRLKAEYKRLSSLSAEMLTKDSPIRVTSFQGSRTPQADELNRNQLPFLTTEADVKQIIQSLDDQNRWLIKHAYISHPYIGDAQNQELGTKYATTLVGDETDTSPFPDLSDERYISTGAYIKNMYQLINYIKSNQFSNK